MILRLHHVPRFQRTHVGVFFVLIIISTFSACFVFVLSRKESQIKGTMVYKVDIKFSSETSTLDPKYKQVVIAGQPSFLKALKYGDVKEKLAGKVNEELFYESICSLAPSMSKGDCCSLWLSQVYVAALPQYATRHNSPSRPHTLTELLNGLMGTQDGCVMIVCERSQMFALGCAVARSFPLYSRKSALKSCQPSTITVEFCFKAGENTAPPTETEIACLTAAAEGIRLAARIVDTPCNEMHTDAFLEEVAKVGSELNIVPSIIKGDELKERGLGGIFGVGKAAVHPPALAILSHKPEKSDGTTIAWVGKGIVYDTGGLSIKGKTMMPGMKRDCGGAAAILGAFRAVVKLGFKQNLHALFCLAENAVGPLSTRPDDIHTFYSGKTVEINNTDAEGRLVLGDGVACASKDLSANIVVDMATLTGAQGVATGKYHSAIVTNNEQWEKASVCAGRSSGDLVHPLPYTPELHFSEFSSAVADMKNSVKNRDNAQSSCAGLFIGAHLNSGFEFPGVWMHFDIAAPVESGERATGYGVALLMSLFGNESSNDLLKSVAPSKQ